MSDEDRLSSDVEAMGKVDRALAGLQSEDRRRVLRWAVDKFGRDDEALVSALDQRGSQATASARGGGDGANGLPSDSPAFDSISDLVEAVNPSSAAEYVLTGTYWFQNVEGAQDVAAQEVNSELKNLGRSPSNITDVFTDLINRKPALVRQVAKSGTSKQARKKYKLTTEGARFIENRITE